MDFKKYFTIVLLVVAFCSIVGTAGATQNGAGGQKPDANFSADFTTGSPPLTVSFLDTSTNSPTSWSWYFGDEDSQTPGSPVTENAGWTERAYPSSVLMPDGSIVLMGGLDNTDQFSRDVWRSTDKGSTWTEKTANAGWSGRFGHSSVALPDGSIVLMGGFDGNGFMNDVWRSTDNGATWQRMTANAGWLPRFYQTSVAMPDGSIVLTGGYVAGSGLRSNDVWRSTDKGATWQEMSAGAGWTGRNGHGCVALPDGSIVVMGGLDGSPVVNDVWRSSDNGATWTKMTGNAEWTPRSFPATVALPDGSIILMGGIDGDNNYCQDIWRSTDEGATWTEIYTTTGWGKRAYSANVAMPDGSVLLLGGFNFDSGSRSNDVWQFIPAGSSSQNPSHTFTDPGTYTITMTATNAKGSATITRKNYITVIPATPTPSQLPIADFVGTPSAGTEPVTVTFFDQSANAPTLWNWSFGDGAFSEKQNPVHTYAIAGSYSVGLKVSNEAGSNTVVKKDYIMVIQVNHPPAFASITGPNSTQVNHPIQFTMNATDPDANPLTLLADPLPTGATFDTTTGFNPITGTFTWTPLSNQLGTYPITFTVSDDSGLTDSKSISVTVVKNSENRAPVLTAIGAQSIQEKSTVQFPVSATDPDNDVLRYTTSTLPQGAEFDASTGMFTWTPDSSQIGTHPVSFMVDDYQDLSDYENVTITVTANKPPVLDQIDSKAVQERHELEIILSATDTPGDILAYSTGVLPDGAGFDEATGTFTWTPSGGQAGTYEVMFIVSDGSITDSENVTITVTPNTPPALDSIGSKSIQERQSLEFSVSGTDPDGDSLIYSVEGLPLGAVFDPETGIFSWITTSGQAGTYPITFKVSDGLAEDFEIVTITVTPNEPPAFISIGSKSIQENQLLQFRVRATDPANDPLTYSTGELPPGAVFDAATQTFIWTPNATQVGSHSVTFTVSDGLLSASETITITVAENYVNQPPILDYIGPKSVTENQQLQFTIVAKDPEGSPLTYSAIGVPPGALFDSATRTFTWTPAYGQAGTHTVTFTVSDGSLTDSESVTITVTPQGSVNQAPILDAIGPKSAVVNQKLQFKISATDPDGNSLTYSTGTLPSGAKFDTSTRTFTWTPTSKQVGSYAVTFTVNDGHGLTDSETVTITVTKKPVNQPPVLDSIGSKSTQVNQKLEFTVSATDPEGDALKYSASRVPSGAKFDERTRTFTWTPNSRQAGTYQVTFTVKDAHDLTDSEMVTITVTANQPPVLNPIGPKSTLVNQKLQFTVSATDPDGDSLTYSASGVPSGASFTAATRTFTWTPSSTQAGTYPVIFTVNDGHGLTDSETVTITVTTSPGTGGKWDVKIVPNTINLKSKGVFIAFVKLPNSYNAMDVQKESVLCRGATATRLIRNPIFPHVLTAVFKVEDLKSVQSGSKVAFTVTGTVKKNGQLTSFSGIDFVKVLDFKQNVRDDSDDFAAFDDDKVNERNPWK